MANNKVNKNRHEYELKVEGENWTKLVSDAYLKVSKNAKVDGFRKGKVPKEVFDKKFGQQDYLIEAANAAVQGEFVRLMKENPEFRLVADPQIHVNNMDSDSLEFTMALIEQPEVKISKYTGLGIKKDEVKVEKEEIDHELSHLLERYSEMVVKESDAVENGDTAIIDFEGFDNGVAFDGGKGENYSLEIGSNTFIPGFEEQVNGMKRGEEKDINVTFPEEYQAANLAGKPVVFKVKVNEIKVKETRSLDKELFEDLGLEGVDTEDKLRDEISASIKAQKETDAENMYVDKLLDAVSKNAEVDIPEEMVFDTTENMFNDFKQRLSMQGIDFNMYQTYTGQTEEQIKSEMEKQAFSRVLIRLTLEEIMKLEKISVDDKEVDERVKNMASQYKLSEEEVLKQLGNKDMLKYDMEMNKVVDFLKEANK